MISNTRIYLILLLTIGLVPNALFAQNDGYQKAGNTNNPQNNYATPGDQPINSSQNEDREDDALKGGNFMIGTGFGYINSVTTIQIESGNSVSKGGNKSYQLHLTPNIGYFITRNFVFGLGMDYLVSSSRDNRDNTVGSASTSDVKLLFGPFSRLYFPFAGDQALFLGGGYGYGKSDTEISDGASTQSAKTTLQTFGVGPGYSIFSHGRVSLETQVKYNYGISRNEIQVANGNQTTRTLTTAWDFVIGMHFYFSRNRS